jgi:hypothetical protein
MSTDDPFEARDRAASQSDGEVPASPEAGKPVGEPPETLGTDDPITELGQRIHAAREAQERPRSGNADMAHGLTVVTSLGFSLAGSILGGIWVGRSLAARTGQAWWSEVGLLVGVLCGFAVAALLLRPFLRSR